MPSNSTYKNPTGSSVYGVMEMRIGPTLISKFVCAVWYRYLALWSRGEVVRFGRDEVIDEAVRGVRRDRPGLFWKAVDELREGGFL